MKIEFEGSDPVIDATLLSELLAIPIEDVTPFMRTRAITSVCETGIDVHAGEFRLTFFHKNRRARLRVDRAGQIIQRSVIDYGRSRIPKPHDSLKAMQKWR